MSLTNVFAYFQFFCHTWCHSIGSSLPPMDACQFSSNSFKRYFTCSLLRSSPCPCTVLTHSRGISAYSNQICPIWTLLSLYLLPCLCCLQSRVWGSTPAPRHSARAAHPMLTLSTSTAPAPKDCGSWWPPLPAGMSPSRAAACTRVP